MDDRPVHHLHTVLLVDLNAHLERLFPLSTVDGKHPMRGHFARRLAIF